MQVSILVLMDFILQHPNIKPTYIEVVCFNPCFNGFHSPTGDAFGLAFSLLGVSILVLMDFILQLGLVAWAHVPIISFNPCFNGFHSPTQISPKTCYTEVGFQSLF